MRGNSWAFGPSTYSDSAGAAVHLESESNAPLCTAPCSVDLPPGPHALYLTRAGFEPVTRQVTVHARETLTPGAKFWEWERKGVPMRLEVGPSELEEAVPRGREGET